MVVDDLSKSVTEAFLVSSDGKPDVDGVVFNSNHNQNFIREGGKAPGEMMRRGEDHQFHDLR